MNINSHIKRGFCKPPTALEDPSNNRNAKRMREYTDVNNLERPQKLVRHDAVESGRDDVYLDVPEAPREEDGDHLAVDLLGSSDDIAGHFPSAEAVVIGTTASASGGETVSTMSSSKDAPASAEELY